MLDISPNPTMLQLGDYLDGIHYCVTVFGNFIFDSNFTFAVPLTKDNLGYCWINDNETKVVNGYKGLLKAITFFKKDNTKSVIQKRKFITCVW